jgi:hypothetical protein
MFLQLSPHVGGSTTAIVAGGRLKLATTFTDGVEMVMLASFWGAVGGELNGLPCGMLRVVI